MDQLMQLLDTVFKVIGLPPELVGSAVGVGILLRFGRGMVSWFGPAHTYGAAVVVGILCGAWRAWRGGVDGAPSAGLAVTAAALLVQFGLQKLAGQVPWLPKDNEWVNGKPKGGKDASPSRQDDAGGAGGDPATG